MTNSNDAIRGELLRTLYDFHRQSKSPRSAAHGIQEIQRALRPKGYKQQEVAHNLDYLLQVGWIVEVKLDRTFKTKAGTVQNAEQVKYKISHTGIDHLEAASMYKRTAAEAVAMNITTINGVTVIGDGNVVNTTFADASRVLSDLRSHIASYAMPEESKWSALADIDTVQTQLQKPSPNAGVVRAVWGSIQKAAIVSGAVDLFDRATELLGNLVAY